MLTREFLSFSRWFASCSPDRFRDLRGPSGSLAWGYPIAGILIPLGFFLSVASPKATTPGSFIYSAYVGVAALGASVLSQGILLIRSAIR